MYLLIKNGLVITDHSEAYLDLLVKDESIVELRKSIDLHDIPCKPEEIEVIDATGKLVLPGGIDAHTHFHLPAMGTYSSDDGLSGSIAAAFGGITSYIDYCAQIPGKSLKEALEERMGDFEGKSVLDYTFHMTLTHVDEEVRADLGNLGDYGISSVKVFTAYKNMMINEESLRGVFLDSNKNNYLVTVHAEAQDAIDKAIDELVSKNTLLPWNHYESRPEKVEAAAVEKVIQIVRETDSSVYFVHLSSEESLLHIKKAKREGLRVFAETCPQYLNFTNDVYKRTDGERFICSPPMKGPESREALWKGIRADYIDTVATDHCPFTTEEKIRGREDFRKAPNGCMGVENLYPYLLSEANQGRITFSRAVELASTNPARIFSCFPKKGTLTVGSDADIILYDPTKNVVVKKENMHSNVDYTIWEGFEMKGYPIMTISRGKILCKDAEFFGLPGWGKFLKCTRKNIKGEKK